MLSTIDLPRFSIVTPSFNQARYLEATIKSVLSQDYPNLEYFIFDGGSNDGSVEIIRRYAPSLTYWESEKDGGQSDAIAKGFNRATGTLLNWLNSDDMLAPEALWQIAKLHRSDPDAGIYAAAVENFREVGETSIREKVVPANLDLESLLFLSGRPVRRHQPGIFFSRTLYERAGSVDHRFHYCMDYDVHARLLLAGGRVTYGDTVVAYFRQHETAKTSIAMLNTSHIVQEYMTISEEAGARAGLKPNHRGAHLHTLCGAMATGIMRGQWREARACFALARPIAGLMGMVACFARQAWRRLSLSCSNEEIHGR